MIPLLNTTLGMVIALCLLLILIASPFIGLWAIFSVCRSLARIADALDGARLATHDAVEDRTGDPFDSPVVRERSIANSQFGR